MNYSDYREMKSRRRQKKVLERHVAPFQGVHALCMHVILSYTDPRNFWRRVPFESEGIVGQLATQQVEILNLLLI